MATRGNDCGRVKLAAIWLTVRGKWMRGFRKRFCNVRLWCARWNSPRRYRWRICASRRQCNSTESRWSPSALSSDLSSLDLLIPGSRSSTQRLKWYHTLCSAVICSCRPSSTMGMISSLPIIYVYSMCERERHTRQPSPQIFPFSLLLAAACNYEFTKSNTREMSQLFIACFDKVCTRKSTAGDGASYCSFW